MKLIIVIFAFSCCASFTAFGQASKVAAQVPKTVAQVPAYPGAKLASAQQEPTDAELAAGKAPSFSFAAEKVWSSADSVDQVARFYAAKLGTAIGQEGGDASELAPGQETAIGSSVDYYDSSGFEDWPAGLRAAFAKRPKLSEEEGWARSAAFSWAYVDASEDPYSFALEIVDKSLSDEDPERYRQATEIKLSVRMFNQKKALALLTPSSEDAEAYEAARKEQEASGAKARKKSDEADAQAAARNAEADRVFGKAPTEAQLGVPVYPGAAYDKQESILKSGGSTERGRCYAYFVKVSGDVRGTMEDVTRFYEQKTKRKRAELFTQDMSEVDFGFFPPKQKGANPVAKDRIVIGYNGVNKMISVCIFRDKEQAAAGGR